MGVLIVVLLFLLLIPIFSAIGAFATMWAWNLAAPLFWHAAPHLNFWTAFAINILCGVVGSIFRGIVSVTTKEK